MKNAYQYQVASMEDELRQAQRELGNNLDTLEHYDSQAVVLRERNSKLADKIVKLQASLPN